MMRPRSLRYWFSSASLNASLSTSVPHKARVVLCVLALAIAFAQTFGVWHRAAHGARGTTVSMAESRADVGTPFDHSNIECRLFDALALGDTCTTFVDAHLIQAAPDAFVLLHQVAADLQFKFAAFRSRAPPSTFF
ncbi:MAG TPA: hypothetical protein VFS42_07840 [Burkholderiaceae bacterium]|nr:hypothetical protein [Burkholderiaceae bacterium]